MNGLWRIDPRSRTLGGRANGVRKPCACYLFTGLCVSKLGTNTTIANSHARKIVAALLPRAARERVAGADPGMARHKPITLRRISGNCIQGNSRPLAFPPCILCAHQPAHSHIRLETGFTGSRSLNLDASTNHHADMPCRYTAAGRFLDRAALLYLAVGGIQCIGYLLCDLHAKTFAHFVKFIIFITDGGLCINYRSFEAAVTRFRSFNSFISFAHDFSPLR